MKILVTGGAGFIGSNFIRYWLNNYPDDNVINFDALTYAGNLDNLSDISHFYKEKYKFIKGDITDSKMVDDVLIEHQPSVIVNFAAESHNSNAIINPTKFFTTNVIGTQTLLEGARKHKISRFHHISTCEVYGDLPLDSKQKFSEASPYKPRTPYNASKAGADHAVRAYFETFHLPITISNCSNNYGPYQFPEKLIPLFITNILQDKQIPIYHHSQNKREWLHVTDHCRAIDLIIKKGKIGETYNIGSGVEKSVEEISEILLKKLNKPNKLKKYVEDRPGHDRRYLLDSSKIEKELNWKPEILFEEGIEQTINWYKENDFWWVALTDKSPIKEDLWVNPKPKLKPNFLHSDSN